jgi:hypothetical protein
MKNSIIMLATVAFFSNCTSEPKPNHQEIKAAQIQVDKDQLAMDSMEKVIQQQIEAVSNDSLMNIEH